MQSDSPHPDIEALRLIGSNARQEVDEISDLDVLAIVSKSGPNTIGRYTGKFDDLSVYTSTHYRKMHSTGHLFTWHVYLESVHLTVPINLPSIVYPDLISRLGRPSDYASGEVDALALISVLDGALKSVTDASPSLIFDAGVIFVALRNLAIITSWYTGSLSFAADAPFRLGPGAPSAPPLSPETYQILRQCRKCSAHGRVPPPLERHTVLAIAPNVTGWADDVLNFIKEKSDAS